MKTIVLTVLLTSVAAAQAHAESIEQILNPSAGRVIYVAPSGNNGAEGSAAAPLKNIDKALKVAKAGDTIAVAAGSYSGTFNIGYLQSDKPVKLYGSFNADFTARSLSNSPTIFAPANASAAKARKPMLSFTKSIDGAVVDGFVFDAGERNSYSPVKAKPDGVATGMLLLPPQKASGQAPTVLEPIIKIPSSSAGGDMRISHNVFLNGPNFGIQAGLRKGKLSIHDNLFVANRMAAIEVYGTCAGSVSSMSAPCGSADIGHNTILFTWARLDDMQDMGYGIRVMTKLAYHIHDNVIGGNVRGGIDHTRFNKDEWITLENNLFAANKWGDMYYSPASNTQLNLRVEEFGDLPVASASGNRGEVPAQLKVDKAYLEGFLSVTYSEQTDLDRGSAANMWRSALGMNLVGSITTKVSMFANRYPAEAAMRLIGAVDGVGARAL